MSVLLQLLYVAGVNAFWNASSAERDAIADGVNVLQDAIGLGELAEGGVNFDNGAGGSS